MAVKAEHRKKQAVEGAGLDMMESDKRVQAKLDSLECNLSRV